MADFKNLQTQLQEALQRQQQAEARARVAREQERQIGEQRSVFDRVFDPRKAHHTDRRARLEEAQNAAAATSKRYAQELQIASNSLKNARAAFEPLTDPRVAVTQLADDVPFLLFPVRLETRFRTVQIGNQQKKQLWVRIYPDDCSIDTFEPLPSEDEIKSTRAYWTGIWEAGGIVDLDRAAWRGLVASHGAGRAAWLVEHYRPTNLGAKPVKEKPEDVVLVLQAESTPPAAEAAALGEFWRSMWIADGDRSPTEAARNILKTKVGNVRAAEVEALPPVNFRRTLPRQPSGRTVRVASAFLLFPPDDQVQGQHASWSRPPRVAAWPDRFVLFAYAQGQSPTVLLGNPVPNPLLAGIDPANRDDHLGQENGELHVPEGIKWMVDFNRAEQVGMGFRIDLNGVTAQSGFDRLVVLGIRASADSAAAKAELEQLLMGHRRGARGLSLVPQGTPTNNTERSSAGYTDSDDADQAFDDIFLTKARPAPSDDWLLKSDGQWVSEWLGIDHDVIAGIPHAAGLDQAEARLMNIALWPATLGYWMNTMMNPVFSSSTVDRTRAFFSRFVSGRGAVPTLRLGNQPYGILVTTAFSRMTWMSRSTSWVTGSGPTGSERSYLEHLRDTLAIAVNEWRKLLPNVAVVGGVGDPHQTFLNVIGLQPTSVSYAQRFAESFDSTNNRLRLAGQPAILSAAVVDQLTRKGRALLTLFGYRANEVPDLLQTFQFTSHVPLVGPLIDAAAPLSEYEPIRNCAPSKNYLEWLVTAARSSIDTLQRQDGFSDKQPPTALLYLLLRYGLLQSYLETGVKLRETKLRLPPEASLRERREVPFIHIDPNTPESESKLRLLTLPHVELTGSPSVTIADHITQNLGNLGSAQQLREQINAIQQLTRVPTARLERLLAEHVDSCSYRIDAWMQGLVHAQLAGMRNIRDGESVKCKQGVLLGAYGWLLDVRPKPSQLSPVQLADGELRQLFARSGQPQLYRDSTNGGYIHAPSLNQATAAAVLRCGFLSNASAANPDAFAIRLSSERVRAAVGLLGGVRSGQSLGALLGYQFERGLHERHAGTEVDELIYDLRQAFPLVSNRMATTKEDTTPRKDRVEARNVVDGERLVEEARRLIATTGKAEYPFGKALPAASAAQRSAVNAEVTRLIDTLDALSDLLMAEGVFEAVQGNYDRVAAALDGIGGGNLPQEPDVMRTPSRGTPLTHRVAVHFDSSVDPTATAVPGIARTPRSTAEPALNNWLSTVLPSLAQIACRVMYISPRGEVIRDVSLADLRLQPLDVIHLLREEGSETFGHSSDHLAKRSQSVAPYVQTTGQTSQELQDRIIYYLALSESPPVPDRVIKIDVTSTLKAAVSICRATPMARALRALLAASRPLKASDLALSSEATSAETAKVGVDRRRVALVLEALLVLEGRLRSFCGALEGKIDDATKQNEVVTRIDLTLRDGMILMTEASSFGIPQTPSRFFYEERHRVAAEIRGAILALVERWTTSLAEFDGLMARYDALVSPAPDEVRFDLLERAERRVSSVASRRPSTASALRGTVMAKRQMFKQRLDRFAAIRDNAFTSLKDVLTEIDTLVPIDQFDVIGLPIEHIHKSVFLLSREALERVKNVEAEVSRRRRAAELSLNAHDGSADPQVRLDALRAGAKALLGSDVMLINEFTLEEERGDEVQKAFAGSSTLTSFLSTQEKVDFPVDEWMYGCARVREQMHRWEQLVILSGAVGVTEPSLTPLQLPYRDGDCWLAGKIAPRYSLDGEHLLYSACFRMPFRKELPQCGLLLDQWTEIIPSADTITGVSFHYDRPNSEPPQTILLVSPASSSGRWQWDDLLGAVNETLDLAKIRAVEPAHLDSTAFAVFLPATGMAASASQMTISTNLSINNKMPDLPRGQK